ncbi:MAG: redox-regulated ATPase YchF [Armatimonadota bacterium]
MVSCGLVGMPNVGKSTVFCALTRATAEVSSYPFCTIEVNKAVVPVSDERLERVGEIFDQETRTPAQAEFIDIAGLVRGAHQGHGLGNQFLANIRQCDAILHVVRCFDRPDVAHVDGAVDAVRDVEVVNLELILADLGTVERRRQKRKKGMTPEQIALEQGLLDKLAEAFDQEKPARALEYTREEQEILAGLFLLTMKPTLIVANVDEDDILADGPELARLRTWAKQHGEQLVPISAQLEHDVAELDNEEARDFVEEMGLPELGVEKVVHAAYRLLNLVTFFTAVGKEARAWPIRRGSTAERAAAKVHTDMAKGFNKAEVIGFEELARIGSWQQAREKGAVRTEGRDYVVKDGDVMHFRFGS